MYIIIMSDVFDNDMMYIQKGGILGMKALRGLVGAWNKYLDSLKLPIRNVTQAQVEEHIPKKFNWRRVITKTAGGVDEVAVQFISKEDPRFSWTTPHIKVKTKKQRALKLAMPSRQQERRPSGLEYMRHLRMTAPTFLRESPRDIARQETEAVFSAVYGEEELIPIEYPTADSHLAEILVGLPPKKYLINWETFDVFSIETDEYIGKYDNINKKIIKRGYSQYSY